MSPAQRSALKLLLGAVTFLAVKAVLYDSKTPTPPGEILRPALLERVAMGLPLSGHSLDPQRHRFLQIRSGRDDRADMLDVDIHAGISDFWNRFQLPFATLPETLHLDEQVIKGVVEELMSFTGWAAAACGSLARPFGNHRTEDAFSDLISNGQLYYFALVVHSADHFLIDQLAAIVQMSRKLGTGNIFVSIVDYASADSTPFLTDLTEAVFLLLGIPFRIRRVDPMTQDPAASYYPLEEAYTRNLALEPLLELHHRRKLHFAQVIWLKGFACPSDILEMMRVGSINDAAMTCSMDWKEHNGFFIFNDRWRTRDIFGNLFRGSKSTSPLDEAPPRDPEAIQRYQSHLPFQVFCCESGVHIVNPAKSYYAGLSYRSSYEWGIFNITSAGDGRAPKWSEGPCMDSAQMHFCRDLFLVSAGDGVRAQARRAKQLERSGQPRGLSEELESIIRAVTEKPAAAAQAGRKGILSDEDLLDDEEDEDWDEADEPAATDAAEGAAAADGHKGGEAPAGRQVDKDVIAAADAAGAELPIEQQHAEANNDRPVQQDRPAARVAAAVADQLEDGDLDGVVDAAAAPNAKLQQQQPLPADAAAPVRKRDKRSFDDSSNGDAPLHRRTKRSKPLGNSVFEPARIIVNPRCVTTYAGVSHTQLALDLFGDGDDKEPAQHEGGKYALDSWQSAPETFVCQEMRTTGGRTAAKQQRPSVLARDDPALRLPSRPKAYDMSGYHGYGQGGQGHAQSYYGGGGPSQSQYGGAPQGSGYGGGPPQSQYGAPSYGHQQSYGNQSSGYGQPPPSGPRPGQGMPGGGQNEQLRQIFQGVDQDRSGQISVLELSAALVNGNWTPFEPGTIQVLMNMFDRDRSGTIGLNEFQGLWSYIEQWQGIFRSHDRDGSGSIDPRELGAALSSFGFPLSPQTVNSLTRKFAKPPANGPGSAFAGAMGGQLTFDTFIRCCVSVKSLTEAFQQVDPQRSGYAQIQYEQFLSMALSAP